MNEENIISKTEDEWKQKLTKEQYEIMRLKGTEPAFSGKYNHEKSEGMYKCSACGNPLFSSSAKFDSGTGWPSFDQAIPGSVKMVPDNSYGMLARLNDSSRSGGNRTEVVCSKCGGHLGHLFDDGPTTTKKRFCMNSVCLSLDKKRV